MIRIMYCLTHDINNTLYGILDLNQLKFETNLSNLRGFIK